MMNPQHSARLTLAALLAISLMGGFAGIVRPAAAQPTGYPDASNTGVPPGTPLTIVDGTITVTTSGTIVENRDIRGCVIVNASNVIIRKSKVTRACIYTIENNGSNLLIEDVSVDCQGQYVGIGLENYTARRVNVTNCENLVWAERNVIIEDSYLHDPVPPTGGRHTDAVQIPSGAPNITIRHNRIYGGWHGGSFGNSAITMGNSTSNITVENNILAGGGYTMYCNQGGRGTNNAYLNNRFSTIFTSKVGGFGPWTECQDENISGNVYHESGLLLAGQSPLPPLTAPTNLRTLP